MRELPRRRSELGREDVTLEVERKFLIEEMPVDFAIGRGIEISQGYLAIGDDAEVRLRRKGARCYLTVKEGSGLARSEYEISLDPDRFDCLWPATAGRRLSKVRYEVPVGALTAELDQYSDELAGLITVEVEFPSVAEASVFNPPEWFGRELTEDPRYANRCLAVDGLAE
jgi:adenylate cyclase